ncbi:MAG: PrsW family intramembrane metalloprotease [Bacteroidaceae bacterium]|nr:PrsW family intramembrane metalloprotease [Bacteroidaceae bacterium]
MDTTLLALIAGLTPAVVLIIHIYMRDHLEREPLSWVLRAVWYGVLCAFPASLIEAALPPATEGTLGGALYFGYIQAALPEEGMKLLFLWLLLRKNPYFDERMDGIVYAVCVSMGFAGLENVLYMFTNLDNLSSVALSRAILSVPGHFFFAVFMGYNLSLALWGREEERPRRWLYTLLIPVLLHGTYDAALFATSIGDWVAVVALIVFLRLCFWMWKEGHKRIATILRLDERNTAG